MRVAQRAGHMRRLLFFPPLFIFAVACGDTVEPAHPTADLELNDVSYLFPLPPAGDLDALLRATSAGARGELLSAGRYASIPKLHVFQTPEETYARLRVVAARIDPCVGNETPCRAQLRLSMQPIGVDSFDGEVKADDASLHLLYALTNADFNALLDELDTSKRELLGERDTKGPLAVHPIIKSEGLRGAYAEAIKTLLLRYAGDQNLERVTFMQLQNFNVNEWVFGGFDVGADMERMMIVDAGSEQQRFINVFLSDEEDFVASVDPNQLGSDDIRLLFNSNNARAAESERVDAAVSAALRIENPTVHDADSTSCVACHLSTPTRLWAARKLGRGTGAHPDRFASGEDLTLTSETQTIPASLRAFGYLHKKVAISQRTVNESAAVVARLNSR